jgi:hypothetical protein
MFVRIVIYSHLVAIALTGLASYLDRRGYDDIGRILFNVAAPLAFLIFVYPLVLVGILVAPRITQRDKLFAAMVEVPATFAHIVAALPMFQ